MTKSLTSLILLFFLTSCTPAAQQPIAAEVSGLTPTPFSTMASKATPTSISPSPSTTPIPCDPFAADFCITDGHFLFQRPIKSPANDSVDGTYRYGSTQDNTRASHHGVDMGNPTGTPVYAAGDGQVVFAGSDREVIYGLTTDFYGNVIVIKHENDLFTLYGHLSSVDVQVDQEVNAGEKIGEVGSEGVAIGSHLHFEVRRGGDGRDYFSTLNPELWLVPKNNENGKLLGALAISILDENHRFINYTEFTVRYHLNPDSPKIKSYYVATYPLDMTNEDENAALGELAPGYYRIALKVNDHVYDRWVEVKSGKLTQVVFVVD